MHPAAPLMRLIACFKCLARQRVAHVYNSWDAMPAVGEQLTLPRQPDQPGPRRPRFLLKPGRKYEQAIKAFEPYDSIKEENPEERASGRALVDEGKAAGPSRKTFIFVNNRLEGNAISTIAAILSPD